MASAEKFLGGHFLMLDEKIWNFFLRMFFNFFRPSKFFVSVWNFFVCPDFLCLSVFFSSVRIFCVGQEFFRLSGFCVSLQCVTEWQVGGWNNSKRDEPEKVRARPPDTPSSTATRPPPTRPSRSPWDSPWLLARVLKAKILHQSQG